MPSEPRAKLARFFVANGRTTVLVVMSLLAAGAVLAFLLGRQTFSALRDVNDPTGAAARLLPQDSVASIATQDSDKDGLTDLEEVRYHTDPHSADSDHDGYADGVEIQNGYDPTAAPGKGVDQSKPAAAPAGDSSLLSSLGLSPVSGKIDGLNVGGLGGLSADSLKQLSDATVPSTERLANLEVDKLLTSSSTPLPTVDPTTVKVRKGADQGDLEAYLQDAITLIVQNNPFPPGYKIDTLLDDVSTGNRAQLERLKVALEVINRELGKLEVPEQALTVHVHALGIVRAGSTALQQLLAAQGNPDANLTFIGRTVFLWNEIRALLKEISVVLKQ